MRFTLSTYFLLLLSTGLLAFSSCNKHNFTECPESDDILQIFDTEDGGKGMISVDGLAYLIDKGRCDFVGPYFDPDFLAHNYVFTDSGVMIVTDGGLLYPTKNDFLEDFEGYANFVDMFPSSVADTQLIWTGFTVQSPEYPTVSDYVALRQCILNGGCGFSDNKLELAPDPTNPANTTLKCTAVAPTKKMVTSKASFETNRPFFREGDDMYYEARYFIESGAPYTLVDFENPYFQGSPGPRIFLQDLIPGIENKFAAKIKYYPALQNAVPVGQWFTLKVHLKFSSLENGILEIWLNGVQTLTATGVNLPLPNSVQASMEIGISAAQERTVVYVDDVRMSDEVF